MATSLGTAVSPSEDTASELQRLRTELARSQQTLHAAQIKIQALTLELARHKRLRPLLRSSPHSAPVCLQDL